jgi:hypothetical protein
VTRGAASKFDHACVEASLRLPLPRILPRHVVVSTLPHCTCTPESLRTTHQHVKRSFEFPFARPDASVGLPLFDAPRMEDKTESGRVLVMHPYSKIHRVVSLGEVLDRVSTLPVDRACEVLSGTAMLLIARDVALYLLQLHSSGLSHASVGPQTTVIAVCCAEAIAVTRLLDAGSIQFGDELHAGDVLSFGVLMASLACRRRFSSLAELDEHLTDEKLRLLPHLPSDMDPPYESFVELAIHCLAEEPDLRPTTLEIVEWIDSIVEEESCVDASASFECSLRLTSPVISDEELNARAQLAGHLHVLFP